MKLFRKRKIIYGCAARGDQNSPYLIRWEIISCQAFAIYLHKFERSDDRSSLHDHPWDFVTIPLRHGYHDCTYNGGVDAIGQPDFNRQLMKPFRAYYRPASHIHFVDLLWDGVKGEHKKAWTLVIRSKYIRYWGFWNNGIFTRYDEYFTKMGC